MGKSESQMDIMEKTTKPRKHRWTVVEIGLSIIVLLMSCALAGLTVLYTSALRERFKRNGSSKGLEYRSNVDSNVCATPECVTAAARLLQNMDPSVKPCQNFYQYACGGWIERHVIPETSSLHSVFNILRDELEIVLKGVLEMENENDREAFKKAKTLYSSCMNEKAQAALCVCGASPVSLTPPVVLIEQRDSQPLLGLIDSIGDWPVASEVWNGTSEESWSLEDTLAVLNARYNKKAVLEMFVWPDDRDSSRHIVHVDQPALGMPSRDYYLSDGNYKKVRKAYLEFMVSMARIAREDRNLTQDEERVWEDMTQVLELETDIANASSPAEERNDITVLYNKMTLVELQQTFNLNGFNWTRYIQGIMSSVSIAVQPEEAIVVYCSPYLEKLSDVLSKYNHRTLQNYLGWTLVMDRVSSLSRRFKDVRAHYRKALHGTTVEEARWRDCVRYVQGNMENAVGALYVRETFSGNSKRMVGDLIKKIQEAYVDTLEELSWMDEQSKEKAREKAMAVSEQIGYPDHILEEENKKLDEEYTHLNFSQENYFENVLENLAASAQKGHKKLREAVDPHMWIIGAAVVNAFYSHNRNQIVFPAGILQPPFFSEKQLQALNFGGIGMVIGHEITHGFDDHGRNFDKDGNMNNWWSNYSAEHFEDQSKCMVEQYGKFSWKLAGGQNVSGITTLGENIADNGGVRQAYKAYIKWVEREGEEPRLPGLDMDHKQLFFLNFAQVWCGACRPEYAIQSIKTDPHSPLEYRVLGSLQNFEAFSEAFHCERGTPMNPKEKCRVW
ncbi:membrane metallo-endopeptidase-like 1 isoform X1 [Triplophysa rosa]|uniref:membrane metallo-endopeptidase-like 1 isoform X1 n=1 Tax=Triplophysa rosa TaxID=992332 RepID=UPI0025462FC6|nr:membrane metallo-endopeptidase-like 1 isoform X1 [Triplophysa rosa]XP_057218392.1 membrane metallo-endopeptidase-like 1 isoform X1 [Triplophysa rosa]